ncbi:TetR/AcrR family transcriptional regulator [Rhodococcus sp. AQ5-07]|uniref:TetR/AcrR family transcriptional regulator n=1 Tax=Rhodococcus sp. AQ5-07 TaxID=2054902 RepID=UPI000DBF4FAC|nr:TetR/AcrR family transcriptional regulator [Rhodococcus sp. AQ5-07]RAL35132.1 TetR/AcrR family transcriptional regulator [Rhodococcus sp. AQ5-07]
MAEKMEPRSPRLGRPPTITSEQIVDEAKRQLQSGGADALSMRALAKSLGTTPMALYRHVGDKEQLISAVLDVYSQDLGALVLPQDQVERLRMIFTAIFETLASERWIIELLQRGGRGGSGAVVLVDRAMAACVELGMSPRRALLVYRALWNYTLGALLNIYDITTRPEGSVSPLAVKIREIGPEKLPVLSEVLEDWPGGTTTESYLEGLEVLISGYTNSG